MSEKFYITTPIYYVNDEPHIGHAYTTILADCLARYRRFAGDSTYFLTGTDEHGQKLQQAAEKAGIQPMELADQVVTRFKHAWAELKLGPDDFIRTTEDRHIRAVRYALQTLWDDGQIYKEDYEGWYCVPDERFWTGKDLVDGKCPECGREVEKITEENYFFRMSDYQDWLVDYIEDHPRFILPKTRRNEVLGFLRKPLGDLCISRPRSRLSWGIPLPFDEEYVTYVWFDALLNYISAQGWPSETQQFGRWWPADMHLIGKDILTTHAVYWPTMLRALGVQPPKTIFAHGWWLQDAAKMSKSLGNVVRPLDMVDVTGVDGFRYFLLREMVPGNDADFTPSRVLDRYKRDLANDLGNLVQRTLSMVERYRDGVVPTPLQMEIRETGDGEGELPGALRDVYESVESAMEEFQVNQALVAIWEGVGALNRYVDATAPWELARADGAEDRLSTVLYNCCEGIRLLSDVLDPFLPTTTKEIRRQLGLGDSTRTIETARQWGVLEPGTRIESPEPIFPEIDANALDTRLQSTESENSSTDEEETDMGDDRITFEEFQQVDLRVARVVAVEKIEESRRLFRVQVDLGDEERQLVAGLAEHYEPEDLQGLSVVVVANMEPATIMGTRSEGMLLAASTDDRVVVVGPISEIAAGAEVS